MKPSYRHIEKDGIHTFTDDGYNEFTLSQTGLTGVIGNYREGGGVGPWTLEQVIAGDADYDLGMHTYTDTDTQSSIDEIKAIASKILEGHN
jgi:hypothetical protein